jgi:hypothetical protein
MKEVMNMTENLITGRTLANIKRWCKMRRRQRNWKRATQNSKEPGEQGPYLHHQHHQATIKATTGMKEMQTQSRHKPL